MGLDIGFESLERYLLRRFDDGGNAHAKAARASIVAEIRRQSRGARVPARNPGKELKGFKFGSYQEIHFLRAFAARTAGYSLAEAYALPERSLSTDPEESAHASQRQTGAMLTGEIVKSLRSGGTVDDGDDVEDDDVDTQLQHVMPVAQRRQRVFPYPQLVCFSDSEGVYLPVAFTMPFVVDGLHVGSSIGLRAELDALGPRIVKTFNEAAGSENEALERFTQYVRELWWRLRHPCLDSEKHRVPFVFQ